MSTPHKSFWSSIPGLLTALAGILTGAVGLGGLAFQLGLVGDKDSSPSTTTQSTTATGGSGATGSADGAVSFTVDLSTLSMTTLDKEAKVTVTNQGEVPLKVKKPDLTGPESEEFSVAATDCTSTAVEVDGSCQITVTYSGGLKATATMTVSADDSSDTEKVALSGSL